MTKTLGMIFADTARLHHRYHHSVFDSFGIHRGQSRLFFVLNSEEGPINQTHLAEKLNISASTLTRMVQSLERKGYLTRRTDEQDQRQTLITLTPEGRAVHDRCREEFIRVDERIFGTFTEEEQESLRDMLIRIQEQFLGELERK